VVYFVRLAVSKELLWGTAQRINVRDKVWKIRTDIGARGAFKIAVDEPGVFLEKLVGNNVPYQTQNEIFDYFGEELQGKIISTLSNFFNNQWPSELIGIEAVMGDLANYLKPQINEMFMEYGLRCESFVISGLNIDTTKYDEMDEAQAELNKASILGEHWAQLTAADILKILAANPGAGGTAATGAGIGMGMAASGAFADLANQMFSSLHGTNTDTVPINFTKDKIDTRFTPADSVPSAAGPSTEPVPASSLEGDPDMAAMAKLKGMLDKGFITQEQYDQKIAEILSRM